MASTTKDNRRVTRKELAEHYNISKPRVTQLVKRGLPVGDDNKIDLDEAERWMSKNLDRERRQGKPAEAGSWREAKEAMDAQLRELDLRRRQGELIDKTEAERAVMERAQAERRAWETWAATAAAHLASELDVSEDAMFRALDAAVRDHLAELSSESLDTFNERNSTRTG